MKKDKNDVSQNTKDEVEIVPKLKNKYCIDLRSALTFWDNYCIVDAYFNQHIPGTEDERKLKERLRKKKFANRHGSFNNEKKLADLN